MIGAVVNALSIVLGGSIGTGLGNKLSDRYRETLTHAISLSVILIGLLSAIKTENVLLLIICMALGSIIGEWLNIEKSLEHLSQSIEKRFSNHKGNISEGFMTATLIFCVGAMSIVGAIESGTSNNHSILFAKSILDGVSALIFSSTLGIGVVLSAVAVLIFEGSITLMASMLAHHIPAQALNELSAIGGLLVMVIGLNILKVTKIRVANMLPAVFLPVFYYILINLIR